MSQLRSVSKLEKILFPIIVTIVVCLILPSTAPLVGMLMLGNLFRECGVVKQLQETASNAMMWYFCRCNHQCRGILKCNYYQDRYFRSGSILCGNHRRRSLRKDLMQGNWRKDQPTDRFCRCIRSSYGSPCIPESRCGGRSDELPADACNGTKRCRCYRYCSSSRYLYGNFRCIKTNIYCTRCCLQTGCL